MNVEYQRLKLAPQGRLSFARNLQYQDEQLLQVVLEPSLPTVIYNIHNQVDKHVIQMLFFYKRDMMKIGYY